MNASPRTLRALAVTLALALLWAGSLSAQGGPGASGAARPTPASLLAPFRFRSIGPAGPGGRIDDIEVAASDPSLIYIAYATGGLFRSTNHGTTFEPVFTTYGSASFGDIAIAPSNPDIVYAGTGEANNRQTSSFGDGMYKTTDGGRTWTHIGLRETQTISRVVVDPHNPDVVYVAANGHLFGPNPDRGVYKTVDGGRTWEKVKYVDENTGFTDLVMDPSNSNTLYAASYQRRRSGCCFNGGGPGSALWKTTDAGRTWTKLGGSGLPSGTLGRIALGVAASNPQVVYAEIEVLPPEGAEATAGGRGGFNWCNNGAPTEGSGRGRGGAAAGTRTSTRTPDGRLGGVYRSDDGGGTWTVMSNCDNRPLYFSQVRVDPRDENTVVVAGGSAAISHDGGRTFTILGRAGGLGEPGHVDIHGIWIDPTDSRHLMLGTDGGLNITWDQGKSWDQVTTMSASLSYVVTADMRRPYHVYTGMQDNGVWGGPSATRAAEGLILNSAWYGMNPGDGFYTAADPTDFNTVYGESQNGNTNRFDLATGEQQSIRPIAPPAPEGAAGPAPGSCVDGRVAGAGPGGFRRFGEPNVLNAQPGDEYRFNWNTPFVLSPHNPRIVWLGGNRLFKSLDRGDTWVASPDLTKQIDRCTVTLMGVRGDQPQLGKNDGVSSYSTITTISESPVTPGVVWAGTDDGNLQVSRDGGRTFTEVGRNLPHLPTGALAGENPYWISRVEASHFDAATAYVSVDGHRSDDLHPYVFVTRDYGRTFSSVTGDLPAYGNVRVIREDPHNKDLLFAGTEFGLFLSLDGGTHWTRAGGGFPTVRTDDVLVHPRDGDLIVATHGRGLWIADDITPLQQLTPVVLAADAVLFDVRPAVAYQRDLEADRCRPGLPCRGQRVFEGENAPRGTAIDYYLASPAVGDVTVSVTGISGKVICRTRGPNAAGLNRVQWTLFVAEAGSGRGGGGGGAAGGTVDCATTSGRGQVEPGEYRVHLGVAGHEYVKSVQVLRDEWMNQR